MKRFLTIFLSLHCLLIFGLCACSEQESQKDQMYDNIYEYAIDLSDDFLTPRETDYGMSREAVLEIKGLGEDAILEDGRVLATISIEGLSDEIMEIFEFSENQLNGVQYFIYPKEDVFEDICEMLYQQAIEIMPNPFSASLEGIREGSTKTTHWRGANKDTYVDISYSGTLPRQRKQGSQLVISFSLRKVTSPDF